MFFNAIWETLHWWNQYKPFFDRVRICTLSFDNFVRTMQNKCITIFKKKTQSLSQARTDTHKSFKLLKIVFLGIIIDSLIWSLHRNKFAIFKSSFRHDIGCVVFVWLIICCSAQPCIERFTMRILRFVGLSWSTVGISVDCLKSFVCEFV